MKANRRPRWVAWIVAALALAAVAEQARRVPLPAPQQVPPEVATSCVEDTDVMRHKHFEFILHQRDETMHWGIRTSKHSLKKCLNCHVQPRADGSYPKHTDPDHFCNACHEYAAVRIDCFECHFDGPEKAAK